MTQLEVPPIDPGRERALLEAFDAHWAQPLVARFRWPRWNWMPAMTAAALVATVAGLNWLVVRDPLNAPTPSEPAVDMAGFVPLPGADAWPPIESGSLVRMDLPAAALAALGLRGPSSNGVVKADVVVGQDGVARAIRVVQ